MLEVSDLSCQRGDRPLFSGLNFRLQAGQVAHITGRNGSGKTTFLRTLCGFSHPLAGTIRWRGQEIHTLGDDYHQELAYVGHHDALHGELTPEENLRHAACLATGQGEHIAQALEIIGLAPYRLLPSKYLSQGQKRRLALARLLLHRGHDNRLWVLDEPFTALDRQSVKLMEGLLTSHLQQDGMIVLTSHQTLDLAAQQIQHIDLEHALN